MSQLQKNVLIFTVLGLLMNLVMFSSPIEKKNNLPKLININTAKAEQLVKLPAIGEKTAKRIIEFRVKHGKFKKIQDLMKVKGIGEKNFKKLEKKITV